MRRLDSVPALLVAAALAFSIAGCSYLTGVASPESNAEQAPLVEEQPADVQPEPASWVSWDEAPQHAGESQRVCGPMASTGNSDNDFFVNLGRPYPDPGRFQFVLWDVGGLPAIAPGEQVCAEGLVEPYEDTYEMQLYSVDQLEVGP